MRWNLRGLGPRGVRVLDAMAVFWVVLWLVLGVLTGIVVWRLSRISDTAQVSASAVDDAGQALQSLTALPVVGDRTAELGGRVRTAAASIDAAAQQTRGDVRRLSVLLGLAVAVIPCAPVLCVYVPLRLRRRSEVESVRRLLVQGDPPPALRAYLAHQALTTLPVSDLLAISHDPVADLHGQHHDRLAAATLEELGLRGPGDEESSPPESSS